LKEVAYDLLHELESLKNGNTLTDEFEGRNLFDQVRRFEMDLIHDALVKTQGHQRKAATLLGLKVTTLNAKMKRYKIVPRFDMPGVDSVENINPDTL